MAACPLKSSAAGRSSCETFLRGNLLSGKGRYQQGCGHELVGIYKNHNPLCDSSPVKHLSGIAINSLDMEKYIIFQLFSFSSFRWPYITFHLEVLLTSRANSLTGSIYSLSYIFMSLPIFFFFQDRSDVHYLLHFHKIPVSSLNLFI